MADNGHLVFPPKKNTSKNYPHLTCSSRLLRAAFYVMAHQFLNTKDPGVDVPLHLPPPPPPDRYHPTSYQGQSNTDLHNNINYTVIAK